MRIVYHMIMRHVVVCAVMLLAARCGAELCGSCAWGKLGLAALASTPHSCENRATQVIVAAYDTCQDEIFSHGQEVVSYAQAKKNACKQAGDVSIPNCLTHMGAQAWVTILITAFAYVSVLPLAIAIRPTLSYKCD